MMLMKSENPNNTYIFLDFDGVLHTHWQTGKDRFSQTDVLSFFC